MDISPFQSSQIPIKKRYRIIADNDFGGDPDGLFQLAHHLWSPSVDVKAVIGTPNYPGGFYGFGESAKFSADTAQELIKAMGLATKPRVVVGSDKPLESMDRGRESEGAKFLIEEAMRADTEVPLVVVCGASLTTLASALLMEPRIEEKIKRVVWIGGPEHEGIAVPPPGAMRVEYNLGIDLKAAQFVFNKSKVPIWQVPRDAYRQCMVSYSELCHRMDGRGQVSEFLMGKLRDLLTRAGGALGEAYVLGDSPLALLTAIETPWEVDPASSVSVVMPTPKITDSGDYEKNPDGRLMRAFTRLDVRLMFEDFFAKVALNDH